MPLDPDDWPYTAWMQSVAAEASLSETAFVLHPPAAESGCAEPARPLRWFTPRCEVDLCGHATLASAHVLWEPGRLAVDEVAAFRLGPLRARPWWAERLGHRQLQARQLSARGGRVRLRLLPSANRVGMAGRAVTTVAGQLLVRPDRRRPIGSSGVSRRGGRASRRRPVRPRRGWSR